MFLHVFTCSYWVSGILSSQNLPGSRAVSGNAPPPTPKRSDQNGNPGLRRIDVDDGSGGGAMRRSIGHERDLRRRKAAPAGVDARGFGRGAVGGWRFWAVLAVS